ncbi:NAD(P)-dependent oxidoreductase [Paracoccus shanxieyensis]|uniref:3-phosphoglycerate dehydrogenase n=1 Tax=Paracoccus shanxieyensis TaxID=2675752 RepID=A0A6L6J210_9RHOB|nr:NAD(P)-dependent oxidoreductase [Paracoccus shanxieyensis]MTH66209.1 3-phosphoglycerate dehydrogenase [Paracoccus shanxieyensis]MTH89443.1 3-phosphoglycerate dehydrogenase [Paracoccus shanxieyensis]
MKCLIVQPIHPEGLARLRDNGIQPVLPRSADMADVAAAIGQCDAVITRDKGLTASAIAAAPALKVISVHGTGHDAVDKIAAADRGIVVCNVPGANARSVAELALGLALAAARGISGGDRAERMGQGGFRESTRFIELQGKTVLIVGWGAIGRELGRMLDLAFGMRVLVHSPRASDIGGYTRVTLEEGLAQADLISLHTPMRPETRHMMNAARFALAKRGAILVNTARQGLVDEAALADALRSGQIAAAGLDTYEHGAPLGPLAELPVVFTPHLGATTDEALIRVATRAVDHVIEALQGRRPATTVNADLLDQVGA